MGTATGPTLAPALWGLPVVQSTLDRAAQFPIPSVNQRVQNLGTNAIERWTGATWIVDSFGTAPVFNIKDSIFGAQGNNSADDTASIAGAQAAANAAGGGLVFCPPGNYKITSPLPMYDGVSFVGCGPTVSKLQPVGCNALSFAYTSGFGGTRVAEIGINGTNCTANTAIIAPGTLNEADVLYGLTLDHVYVTNFNTALSTRTVRNLLVQNCWFQNVTEGIVAAGMSLVIRILNNYIVFAGGGGAGTSVGVTLTKFNYTGGTGNHNPEGIQVVGNQIFGFPIALTTDLCTYLNVVRNDIEATNIGIEFSTVQNGFNVTHNHIELDGPAATYGIIGHGVGSTYNSRAEILTNTVIGTGTVSCVGIQVNDSGNQNQDNVRLSGNIISGMTTRDIRIYNGNNIQITGNNRCLSPSVGTVEIVAPRGPHRVDGNDFAVAPVYNAAGLTNGLILVGVNIVNGVETFPPNTQPVLWGTDNSGNPAALITASPGVKGIVAQAFSLQVKASTSVTTATAIGTVSTTYGVLAEVHGSSGGNIFSDLLYYALGAATVIASRSISGAPAARTYTVVAGVLTLAMASGTYVVSCQELIAAG